MLIRTVLAAAALAAATPVLAQPVTVTVPHADLDLTREAGRKALEARVARAAEQVCGPIGARALSHVAAYRACLAEARASAQPQVELALNAANSRRVAMLSTRLAVFAGL
jgi:UrcA family protein